MASRIKVWVAYYGNRFTLEHARRSPRPRRLFDTLRSAYEAAAAAERLPVGEYVRRCEVECGSTLHGILTAAERAAIHPEPPVTT